MILNVCNSANITVYLFNHYKWHTFWSSLITCANMKWIWRVLLKIQSGHDSVHRRTDGQMDKHTDGQTYKVKPVCPPFNFVEARGTIRGTEWQTSWFQYIYTTLPLCFLGYNHDVMSWHETAFPSSIMSHITVESCNNTHFPSKQSLYVLLVIVVLHEIQREQCMHSSVTHAGHSKLIWAEVSGLGGFLPVWHPISPTTITITKSSAVCSRFPPAHMISSMPNF